MTVITRFAPSPTGLLHIGNVRTALINWLYTKKHNGKFMLRLDDTDPERSKLEYALQIEHDLKWLGFSWDIFAKQSDRITRYEEIKQQLINAGRLYPCFETPEELEIKRKMQLTRGKPPIYDRAALKLSPEEVAKMVAGGKKPHYRFKMLDEAIIWNDMVRGEIKFEGSNLSDPILVREDQSFTYILCSVIDDIDYSITHIIRGEDHISNTAIQVQIFKALNATIPEFGHLALIKAAEGEMSKRIGGFEVLSLQQKHIEAISIATMLAKLGTSDPIQPRATLEEIIDEFDISKFNKAVANYDQHELINFNHKTLGILEFKQVEAQLKALGLNNVTAEFWLAIRSNIVTIDEASEWWQICFEEMKPIIENPELLQHAIDNLPEEPWDNNTWKTLSKQLSAITGLKGKDLFLPIRKALTAKDHGPELNLLLPLIGKERAIKRLNGKNG
ncbi:glutamate--tRNA ligase [Rickettsiales endosymbiont of Stachyamoeba lipophora]|nr:glutamate--tRNA ligase [Rickettsiales endosymbiont of Stachyamoeba lipophora]